MANILTLFKQKITIDYQEWRSYMISKWNVQRDNRMIDRAVKRARMKNKEDGRTYYIMKDLLGGINELNRSELVFFKNKGLFTADDYKFRLERAIAIVTSNKVEFKQYKQQQLKKEE